MPDLYDVCIIGAGVVGCAVARQLAHYDLRVALLERTSDVVGGATRANSGIVHGGYSAHYGTLKAALCRKGNRMYRRLNEELQFGYRESGSLVVALDQHQHGQLAQLYENGLKNGVNDLELLGGTQTRQLEPALSARTLGSLYCPTTGVTSPYEMAIALAENAVANGVELWLSREVVAIEKTDLFTLQTPTGTFHSRYVVNAAGVFSDKVAAMVGDAGFAIVPRQGQYLLLDRGTGDTVRRVVFQVPSGGSKGILVAATYHGNLIIGPNAQEVSDREEDGTTMEILLDIVAAARRSVPDLDLTKVITTYSGLRATSSNDDFEIGPGPTRGFINAAGIDSPGLTSSPAIAQVVRDHLANDGLDLRPNAHFKPERRGIIITKDLTDAQVASRLERDGPEQIICRCERVTRGEIEDALGRGIPVSSIAGVKYRTRAGMGRCQGAFCRPRVAALLQAKTGVAAEEIVAVYERSLAEKNRIKTALIRHQSDLRNSPLET